MLNNHFHQKKSPLDYSHAALYEQELLADKNVAFWA